MAQGFPGFSAADTELLQLQESFEESQRLQRQGRGRAAIQQGWFHNRQDMQGATAGWESLRGKEHCTTVWCRKRRNQWQWWAAGRRKGALWRRCGTFSTESEGKRCSWQSDTLKYSLEEYFIIIIIIIHYYSSKKKDTESLLPGEVTRNYPDSRKEQIWALPEQVEGEVTSPGDMWPEASATTQLTQRQWGEPSTPWFCMVLQERNYLEESKLNPPPEGYMCLSASIFSNNSQKKSW